MSILELTLEPLIGVGPVQLGAPRDWIVEKMRTAGQGISATSNGHLYFVRNAIQVEFQSDGTASFIGVAPDPGLRLLFRGVDLFRRDAPEVFALFQAEEDDGATWSGQM